MVDARIRIPAAIAAGLVLMAGVSGCSNRGAVPPASSTTAAIVAKSAKRILEPMLDNVKEAAALAGGLVELRRREGLELPRPQDE